jgi:hypothetical protein
MIEAELSDELVVSRACRISRAVATFLMED